MVDCMAKYCHFIPLPSILSTERVALALIVGVFLLDELSRTIINDRDPRFFHSFWQEINSLQGSTLNLSTTYHPQTDG